jgi:hypothetical protein
MTPAGRLKRVLALVTFGSMIGPPARGAEPHSLATFPMGVSRAGVVELSLSGTDLKDARGLFFSVPGLRADRLPDGRFAVKAAGDIPLRHVDVWAVTPSGLSNPSRLAVSDLPVVAGREKDGEAQPVELPVVIDGAIDPATDRDDFLVPVRAGQRVAIAFRSQSLGGSVLPALTVFAPDGRELLHDPGGQAEPTLDLLAPEEGTYRVRVEDRSYRRDAYSTYRLTLFTGPRVVAAFPNVLTRGKTQAVTLFGYGLGGGTPVPPGAGFAPGLERIEVAIDAPSAGDPDGGGWALANALTLDGFAYSHPGSHGPVRFGLVDQEVTLETDRRHETLETAQEVKVKPAGVIAGRFLRPGEVDWYRFAAEKDQTLWVEAVGERSGLAMDLDVAIHDARGKLLLALADTAQPKGSPVLCPLDTLDPSGAFKVPADGDYALMIRDLYGPIASGVERTYRLHLGPPREGARVVAIHPNETTPSGLSLAPGGRAELQLIAVRTVGHDRPITVRAEGLPPGLEAEPTTIPAGKLTASLTLKAAQDAPAWVGLLTLRAESETEGQTSSVPVLGATLVRSGKPLVVRRCEGVAVAVLGTTPENPPPARP